MPGYSLPSNPRAAQLYRHGADPSSAKEANILEMTYLAVHLAANPQIIQLTTPKCPAMLTSANTSIVSPCWACSWRALLAQNKARTHSYLMGTTHPPVTKLLALHPREVL